jgi:hypothetical protein
MLLNGLIQPFQQPERVVGFFGTSRNQYPVSRDLLRDIAQQSHNWVKNRSVKWGAPILDAPPKDRDKFAEPFFRRAKPDQIVAICSTPPKSTSDRSRLFRPCQSRMAMSFAVQG